MLGLISAATCARTTNISTNDEESIQTADKTQLFKCVSVIESKLCNFYGALHSAIYFCKNFFWVHSCEKGGAKLGSRSVGQTAEGKSQYSWGVHNNHPNTEDIWMYNSISIQ